MTTKPNTKTFGYVRVSTRMQNPERQIAELQEICDEVFIDRKSGKNAKRPQLQQMMQHLRGGDQIVVLRLARFGRSSKDLAALADKIISKGATLKSLKEGFVLDGTPMGKMLYTLMGALAEFEREVIRDRTMEGIEIARRKGRIGGRPKGLSAEAKKKARLVASLYLMPDEYTVRQIADTAQCSITTLYKYLEHEGIKKGDRYKKTSTRVA